MLSTADNELLTRTGPGTAMGDLRDTEGRVGLLDPRCPHRGAARSGAAYAVRSGSALADRSVPFAEVMVQRFGDPVGRVPRGPAGAQAPSAMYSSPRSSLSG